MYIISSIVFSSVDDLNFKFNKKQSEKLKHYEGEHFKNRRHDERRKEHKLKITRLWRKSVKDLFVCVFSKCVILVILRDSVYKVSRVDNAIP